MDEIKQTLLMVNTATEKTQQFTALALAVALLIDKVEALAEAIAAPVEAVVEVVEDAVEFVEEIFTDENKPVETEVKTEA